MTQVPKLLGSSLGDAIGWISRFVAGVERGDITLGADASDASGYRIGDVYMSMRADVPEGYLFVEGQTLSKTTYAELYLVVGDAYTPGGTPSTHFGLPDGPDPMLSPVRWVIRAL